MSVGIGENGDVLIVCRICKNASAVKTYGSKIFKCNGQCCGDAGCGGEFYFKEYDENGNYLHPNFQDEYLIIVKK